MCIKDRTATGVKVKQVNWCAVKTAENSAFKEHLISAKITSAKRKATFTSVSKR